MNNRFDLLHEKRRKQDFIGIISAIMVICIILSIVYNQG
jgi:hypothetical protein